jgi:hypothetical protein
VSLELYVAPAGTPTPGPSFTTITAALTAATPLFGVIPVTINVFPGTYNAANGETFPFLIPAHGVCIESMDVQDPVLAPASIVGGGPIPGSAGAIIFVSSTGNTAFPDSLIRGLDLQPDSASFAIRVDPAGGSDALERAVEIRDNFIHGTQCVFGIDLQTKTDDTTMDVVEGNWIVTEREQGGIVGVRIVDNGGVTSCVLRSNQIARFEDNVDITGPEKRCRPRLFSNLIQVAERNVNVTNASPILVNNTIAHAFNFTTQPTVFGITGNGTVDLVNNLIWNQQPGSNAVAAVDIDPALTVIRFLNNHVEDFTPTVLPQFVSGPGHPGLGLVVGARPPVKDLHLAPTSPLIDAGNLFAYFDPANTPPIPVDSVNGMPIRRDVNLDVDYDPRALTFPGSIAAPFTPDIGGDEVTDGTRIARSLVVAAPGIPMDAFGSLRAITNTGTTIDHQTSIDVTTPAVAGNTFTAFVFLGAGYNVTLPTALGTVANRSVFEDSLVPGIGQIAIDMAPTNAILISTGSLTGGGTFPVTVNTSPVAIGLDEAEMYLQTLVVETNALGATISVRVSNRMFLELNQ